MLKDCSNLTPAQQHEIMVDVYKIHLNVLEYLEKQKWWDV